MAADSSSRPVQGQSSPTEGKALSPLSSSISETPGNVTISSPIRRGVGLFSRTLTNKGQESSQVGLLVNLEKQSGRAIASEITRQVEESTALSQSDTWRPFESPSSRQRSMSSPPRPLALHVGSTTPSAAYTPAFSTSVRRRSTSTARIPTSPSTVHSNTTSSSSQPVAPSFFATGESFKHDLPKLSHRDESRLSRAVSAGRDVKRGARASPMAYDDLPPKSQSLPTPKNIPVDDAGGGKTSMSTPNLPILGRSASSRGSRTPSSPLAADPNDSRTRRPSYNGSTVPSRSLEPPSSPFPSSSQNPSPTSPRITIRRNSLASSPIPPSAFIPHSPSSLGTARAQAQATPNDPRRDSVASTATEITNVGSLFSLNRMSAWDRDESNFGTIRTMATTATNFTSFSSPTASATAEAQTQERRERKTSEGAAIRLRRVAEESELVRRVSGKKAEQMNASARSSPSAVEAVELGLEALSGRSQNVTSLQTLSRHETYKRSNNLLDAVSSAKSLPAKDRGDNVENKSGPGRSPSQMPSLPMFSTPQHFPPTHPEFREAQPSDENAFDVTTTQALSNCTTFPSSRSVPTHSDLTASAISIGSPASQSSVSSAQEGNGIASASTSSVDQLTGPTGGSIVNQSSSRDTQGGRAGPETEKNALGGRRESSTPSPQPSTRQNFARRRNTKLGRSPKSWGMHGPGNETTGASEAFDEDYRERDLTGNHEEASEEDPTPLFAEAVPFPTTISNDPPNPELHRPRTLLRPEAANSPLGNTSSSTGLQTTLMQQTASDPIPIRRPTITRGRFQSEIGEGSLRPKLRPSSFEEASTRFRARNESMGPGRNGRASSGSPVPSASDLMMRTSSRYTDVSDDNVVRKTLIVKEDGKPSSRYQLGNCIGRGQFGSVYRALNVSTGQTVAVKRIPLEGLSDEEVTQLTNEVLLLKSLSHYSIVKYEGMVRDDDTLNIVLEYVENGSLSHTIKAFGKLNERLVAGYVTKILEGLHYLHLSQVVHCDLKAANILTTKNGNVKLSDFGVSLNLRAMENIRRDNVAGTPNWMAPEVIELQGASTASDIWSLGCTIVELLTGRPPYGEIANSMSVMFHIVEDDMPPMPPGISDPLRDFLTRCFQKDPRKRPSAEILFEHEWLKADWGKYKELRPQDSIPFLRRVSADLAKTDMVRQLSLMGVDMSGQEYGALPSPFDERPQPVKRLSTGLSSPLLSGRAESPVPRAHSFVKTTFNKAVICRVCNQPVKKSAVLCEECSLVAHARCAPDAPPSCDLRAQLLMYAQDWPTPSQSPTGESILSGTPPRRTDSPLSSSPPGAFKIFNRRMSRSSSHRDPSVSPDPPSRPSSLTITTSREDDLMRRATTGGRTRKSVDEYTASRLSFSSSNPNTSSLRSALPEGSNLGHPSEMGYSARLSSPSAPPFQSSPRPLPSMNADDPEPNLSTLLPTFPLPSSSALPDMADFEDPTSKRRRLFSRKEHRASRPGCLVQ